MKVETAEPIPFDSVTETNETRRSMTQQSESRATESLETKPLRVLKHFIGAMIPGAVALTMFGFASIGARAATIDATFNAPSDVPITTNSYTASGNTVNFTLNFTPTTGTELTVVKHTGLNFINGTFDNLAQGQAVMLVFGGIGYRFVANYFGGSGNDLVLVWASNRVFAWGMSLYGQLGTTPTNTSYPQPVTATGVLSGKTVLAVAAGSMHSLALCSDGSLAAWGHNNYGQLGDNAQTDRHEPVLVNASASSALFGKTVIALAAGGDHSLALCSDGTVATWGNNGAGQLGDNSTTRRLVPVAVSKASGVSALYGKTVVAITAGQYHSAALCSDGTAVAWGANAYGEVGDNTSGTNRLAPTAVNTTAGISALFDKTVVAIECGQRFTLALCSDGTVAGWGNNGYSQLGNTNANRLAPGQVNTNSGTSILFGKSIVAIAAGDYHSLALCSDGVLTAWGQNDYRQLGDNSSTIRWFPVAVNMAPGVSALYGKTITGISAGYYHSLAVCSDGTAAGWGYSPHGQIGDGNIGAFRNVPAAVSTNTLAPGERFLRAVSGPYSFHTVGIVASPSVAAPEINVVGNGTIVQNGDTTTDAANHTDFGDAAVGGGTVVRTFKIENTGTSPLNLTGAPKVSVIGAHATDFTVTQQPTSPIAISSHTTFQVTFTPSAGFSRYATLTIANDDVDENPFTFAIRGFGLGPGELDASYTNGTEVPLVASEFTATSNTVRFTLNYAPTPGTELVVVQNTGLNFIDGNFENLTNGQPVALSFGGIAYDFVANYYGGSGNDLVLVWARNRAFAWGNNWLGPIGDGTTLDRRIPTPVTATGVFAGKTLVDIAAGRDHNVVLCSDGTVAAWGWNGNGQVGDNTQTDRLVPVLVNTTTNSALFGKRVVAVAAGNKHSLALCSDGAVAAWGFNGDGLLGDNTTTDRLVPVAVDTTTNSALFGKTVVAITAGRYQSAALCSDGTVACWGLNDEGQLGNGGTNNSPLPVAVNTGTNSALFGKTVVAISSGLSHTLALSSDGTLAGWGQNTSAQLGEGFKATMYRSPVAVKMDSADSALFGKSVAAIAAGRRHSAALCTDGTVATWGDHSLGALGTNSNGLVPKAVNTRQGVSALYGKTVTAITASYGNTLGLCSDDALTAWGLNDFGQVGNNTTTNCFVPMAVNQTNLAAGERFILLFKGAMAYHTLALVASPISPLKLQVRPGTHTFTFEWPSNYSGFIPQANSDLSNTNGWIDLTNTPVFNGTNLALTLPTTDAIRFFRLRSP